MLEAQYKMEKIVGLLAFFKLWDIFNRSCGVMILFEWAVGVIHDHSSFSGK